MFGTTVYLPVEGGHKFKGSTDTVDEALNNACGICAEPVWKEQHRLIEEHRADAYAPGPGLYCVEASDDGTTYATNGLRWSDVEDAKRWATGLSMRWFGCTNIRVRACDDAGEPTGDTVHQTL